MLIFNRFLEWLGNKTGTVILIPHPIAIGSCAEEIYFGLIKARRENKKLLLLVPYQLPGRLRLFYHQNRALLQLQNPYRSPFQDSVWYAPACWMMTLYFGFFRSINIFTRKLFGYQLPPEIMVPMGGQEVLWQPDGFIKDFSWDIVHHYNWPKEIGDFIDIEFPSQEILRAEQLRGKIGLPLDAWFVCLHVREGGYYSDHDATPTRNANIENYIEAIKEITNRGGWVVRMGDATMKRLPPMERVIDYPFTEAKDTMMDLYLIKHCRVYMGMLSGLLDLALLFQRPTITVNMCSWLLAFPQRSGDLGLFKRAYSKSQNRFLSPFEWPKTPWGGHSSFYPEDDYEFHENTPEELRAVVFEYFSRSTDWSPSDNQKKFNAIRIEGGKELLTNGLVKNDHFWDMVGRYRVGARLYSAEGYISDAFLQQYVE